MFRTDSETLHRIQRICKCSALSIWFEGLAFDSNNFDFNQFIQVTDIKKQNLCVCFVRKFIAFQEAAFSAANGYPSRSGRLKVFGRECASGRSSRFNFGWRCSWSARLSTLNRSLFDWVATMNEPLISANSKTNGDARERQPATATAPVKYVQLISKSLI